MFGIFLVFLNLLFVGLNMAFIEGFNINFFGAIFNAITACICAFIVGRNY